MKYKYVLEFNTFFDKSILVVFSLTFSDSMNRKCIKFSYLVWK